MTMAPAYDHRGYPLPGEWTVDDLYALPEDGMRRELVDGVLVEMPSPKADHQLLAALLTAELHRGRPSEYAVTQAVDVRFDLKNSRCPDLPVVAASAMSGGPSHFAAEDVVLAVEIVSPSTKSQDRFAKPIQYAQAGIPHYWRIDLEPKVVVNVFRREEPLGGYALRHEFSEELSVDEPWPIRIPFDTFVPSPR
ncbi:MAG: Uma2 family endonuclease [Stackebrandtia sp.]